MSCGSGEDGGAVDVLDNRTAESPAAVFESFRVCWRFLSVQENEDYGTAEGLSR